MKTLPVLSAISSPDASPPVMDIFICSFYEF